MPPVIPRRVAIVDYGLGNLFSVRWACAQAGLDGFVTRSGRELLEADAVILPGVGAFSDAITALSTLDLVSPLSDVVAAGRPLFGICLGMQLLMTESHEFGRHRGLGFLEGEVVRLHEGVREGRRIKVPHIGWSAIHPAAAGAWRGSPLEDLAEGTFMYFVHSYVVQPADASCIRAVTDFGGTPICSSLSRGNVFGCQFHPERSGPAGLRVYRALAAGLGSSSEVSWTRQ